MSSTPRLAIHPNGQVLYAVSETASEGGAVPMTMSRGEADVVTVISQHGTQEERDGLELTAIESKDLFERSGEIVRVHWNLGPAWQ